MPTYEYLCEKCQKTFEVFQSMKDEPLMTCPPDRCQEETWGQGPVKRQLGTGAGLIFKGSGFYITDYRSDNYKAAAKKESSSGGSESSSSSSGSSTEKKEAKPAAKTTDSSPKAAKDT